MNDNTNEIKLNNVNVDRVDTNEKEYNPNLGTTMSTIQGVASQSTFNNPAFPTNTNNNPKSPEPPELPQPVEPQNNIATDDNTNNKDNIMEDDRYYLSAIYIQDALNFWDPAHYSTPN